jgi:two-component system, LytTR family, sensor kinase
MTTGRLANIGRAKYGWLIKYKLYHLPFWFVYHYTWWTLRIGSPLDVANSIFYTSSAFKFFFYMVFQAIGVYFNLYFLIPKYLEKGRYLQYLSFLLLTIVTTAALIVSGYYVGAWLSDKTFQEMYHLDPNNYFSLFESGALPSTAASMTLAMSIKLTKNWIQARRREQLLEKEKLETELKFLKAQFNPHFLFNTINSIFVLIHKNPKMASESLAKFSDLLRYQLYECNEHQIPVTQELSYIENYIELQKLRQDGNIEMTFHIERPMNDNLVVTPFIVMPFIENAFKHVSQHKNTSNWIKMNLHFDRRQLVLDISNSTSLQSRASTEAVSYHGIGLKNVQRRLDLLYPGMYDLKINGDHNRFQVNLILKLAEQKVLEFETMQMG